MVGTARKLGQWVYRVVRSPTWRAILETSQDLRDLPTKIIRDAGLEETIQDIKQTASDVKSDLDDTTREINAEMRATSAEVTAEMQAATQQVNSEMQAVARDANAGMKGIETPALGAGIAPGLAIAQSSPATAEQATSPATEEVIPPSPYVMQLDAFATGLSGKVLQSAESEQNALLHTEEETTVSNAPAFVVETLPSFQHQPYTLQLDTFAGALGTSAAGLFPAQQLGASQPAPETEAASSAEAPPLAAGVAPGLSLQPADGMQVALQGQMEKMQKSLEKLDAQIASSGAAEPAPADGELQPTPPQAETAPPDRKGEPVPAKPRRKPAEAAAENREDETSPAVPRKKRTPRAKATNESPAGGRATQGPVETASPEAS